MGISSAGRAPALHAGGQEFESPILHHKKDDDICYRLFYFRKVYGEMRTHQAELGLVRARGGRGRRSFLWSKQSL